MKKVKVTFTYLETDGSVREAEMFIPLSLSRSKVEQDIINGEGVNKRVGPWMSSKEVWEGELDAGEIARLKALPGHGGGISAHWRFGVEEVK